MTSKKGLWAIMEPVKGHIITAMVLSAIGGATTMIGYVFLAYSLSLPGGNNIEFLTISIGFNQMFLIVAFMIIFSFIIRIQAFGLSHLGAFKLEEILRTQITEHLAKVPLGFIITTGTGPLKKVLLEDVKNLHAFVADTTPFISKSIAAPAASLTALLIIDYRMALVALSVLLAGAFIMFFAMKDEAIHRTNYERSQSDINKAVIEFVQAMPVVRTFDDGTTSFKRYNEALKRFRDSSKAWITATSLPGRIATTILSPLPTLVAVTIAGIFFVISDSLTFVEFIAVLLISTGMADALMPIMWGNIFIKQSKSAAMRIHEIMDLPGIKETPASKRPQNFDLVFDNVSFKYNKTDDYALKNISFTVPENTTTALVGPSGAGKSSIAKLIPRFWDVTQGSVKIGGKDIKDMDTTTLMDTVSFVFQDTFLFNDTLANNIKIAENKASDADVIAAAKAARIHDFIMTLPDGYETIAGDRGTKLSGGQKQRITIARAILRNTPVVVLDEATAFADPENEEEIIKALSNLAKNKTIIVIAHRMSSIKNTKQILVLDKGRLVEAGNHDELLEKQGTYSRLWKNHEKSQNWNLHGKGDVK